MNFNRTMKEVVERLGEVSEEEMEQVEKWLGELELPHGGSGW